MKKRYFIFTLISLSIMGNLKAQSPVLTAANSNPQIGDSFTGHGISYTSPGSAGASQTWDFSAVTSSSSTTVSVVDATTTPNAASFPAATLATYNPTTSSYNYFSVSSSAISAEGYDYGPPSNLIIPYSNPQVVLNYPFSMGSTFTDSYSGTYTSGASTITRKGTSTVIADGYGTLILPFGTLNNVLRISLIDDYADTTSLGAPYAKYTFTTYNWYLPGTHYQVMSLTSLNSNGGPPLAQFGTYLDPASVGITAYDQADAGFSIYPNPASTDLYIQSAEKIKNIKCLNNLGQVQDLQMNDHSIAISSLAEGLYFLTLTTESGKVMTKKFMRQ